MNEKFFVKRTNGYYVGLYHYEGISKVIYNILYDIMRDSEYDKVIPEEYLLEKIEEMKEAGTIKYVKPRKH